MSSGKPRMEPGYMAWTFLNKKPDTRGPFYERTCGALRAVEALFFAKGAYCCRIELSGDVDMKPDYLHGSRMIVLWGVDATAALDRYARFCALDVADMWNMPRMVRDLLVAGEGRSNEAQRLCQRAVWGAMGPADPEKNAAANAAAAALYALSADSPWGRAKLAQRFANNARLLDVTAKIDKTTPLPDTQIRLSVEGAITLGRYNTCLEALIRDATREQGEIQQRGEHG